MSKINVLINDLKEKREAAIKLQQTINRKRAENDIQQFYDDSLKITNMNDGMVVIITPEMIIKERANGGLSHRKVAQEIFNSLPVKHINFSDYAGDFGELIPTEYNAVFIRMSSILNGPTIVYYPEQPNKFQIEAIEKFNDEIKKFNNRSKEQIIFEYNGKTAETSNNLDNLLIDLNENIHRR